MKRILIVGGGEAQLPLIKSSNLCGYYTIVCDANPNAVGVDYANKFCKVSTKDPKTLLRVAKDCNIDGIVANSEYAMCDVASISSELGLVGNSRSAIDILSSKTKFRQLQRDIGEFCPKAIEVSSQKEAFEAIRELVFPIIIKPSKSSGSRGTEIIYNRYDKDKISNSFELCSMYSRNKNVTIEEYIDMPSNSVIEGEIFLNNGEILWDGLFTTIRCQFDTTIPMTYVFPAKMSTSEFNKVKETLSNIFKSINIQHGEYNVELYFSKGKVFVIEINARQGGNALPHYVQKHCGVDMYKLLVTTSVGDNSYWIELNRFDRCNKYIVHHVLYPNRDGIFTGITVDDKVKKYVTEKHIHIDVGNPVEAAKDASYEIGYIDMEFDTREMQTDVCNEIEKNILINAK